MPEPATFLPPLRWLRQYDRELLRADLVAGLTVAVMLVPQAMAYAALAGVPPVTGLYAAVVPLVVYAMLGTSSQLAIGPVALVSLLTASALAPLAGGDPQTYLALAAALALLVGAMQVTMGILRLGVLVNFLSHSVISGFTSAAAVIIAATQIGALLGIDTERTATLLGAIQGLVASAGPPNPWTVVIATLSITTLLAGRRYARRVPWGLLVVALATLATWFLDLADRGVAIVGDVPAGLPTPALPSVTLEQLSSLLLPALVIALIAYLENIGLAKAVAVRTREEIDANQELIAAGAANLAAGVFRAFPVAGGFARTAVSQQAGARTPMTGLVAAAVVAVALTLLTPLFFFVPGPVLAAIIVVSVLGLIDLATARQAWRVKRPDAVTFAATFGITLALGVELGIAVGIALSLALFVWRTANPHTAELGRVEGTTVLRNVERYPTRVDPRVAVLRIDGPLYFANAKFVETRLVGLLPHRPRLEAIVLDCSAVTDLDTSGTHTLANLGRELAGSGVTLHLATVRGPVRDVLRRSGLWATFGPDQVHADVDDALEHIGIEPDSPLRSPAEGEGGPSRVF